MADDSVQISEFSVAQVRKAIADWWNEEQGKLKKPGTSREAGAGSILEPLVEIDSHRVARCLTAIEAATGIDIPAVEAEDTEFDSYEAMVETLVPIAARYYEKQKGHLKKGKDDAGSGAG